ncbi:MAG: hypothetical protein ABWK15_05130 [Dissulfuribacterales bacterium]
MLNTFKIYQELASRMDQSAAEGITNILGQIYEDLKNTVTRDDFALLTGVVRELSEAQKRTEQRVEELAEAQRRTEQRVEELAEAQRRTEQRVEELAEAQKRTEQRVEELAEAQRRTEQRVEELAEAQKRTEQRVEELAEAQRRTEQRVEELAEAQRHSEGRLDRLERAVAELAEAQVRMAKRLEELVDAQKATERRLYELIGEVNDIKVQLGGLAMAVGYGIEDRLMPFMKRFVPKIYGASVQKVERKNVRYSKGNFDEVNIYIEALKDAQPLLIAGECKAQPSKKDIRRFSSMLMRLSEHFKMPVEGFLVGYVFSPDVEDLLAQDYPHIKAFKTYEVEMIAT